MAKEEKGNGGLVIEGGSDRIQTNGPKTFLTPHSILVGISATNTMIYNSYSLVLAEMKMQTLVDAKAPRKLRPRKGLVEPMRDICAEKKQLVFPKNKCCTPGRKLRPSTTLQTQARGTCKRKGRGRHSRSGRFRLDQLYCKQKKQNTRRVDETMCRLVLARYTKKVRNNNRIREAIPIHKIQFIDFKKSKVQKIDNLFYDFFRSLYTQMTPEQYESFGSPNNILYCFKKYCERYERSSWTASQLLRWILIHLSFTNVLTTHLYQEGIRLIEADSFHEKLCSRDVNITNTPENLFAILALEVAASMDVDISTSSSRDHVKELQQLKKQDEEKEHVNKEVTFHQHDLKNGQQIGGQHVSTSPTFGQSM